ncbi:GNAT family N-acetyltransferase [Arthrobacter sp. TMN-49]
MTVRRRVPVPDVAGLRFRPLAVGDADAWLALVVRIATAEGSPWPEQLSELMEVLESAANPAPENTVVGLDVQGVPRAYGYVSKDPGEDVAIAAGGVDPLWQRRGIGSAVLAWQQGTARERFAADGLTQGTVRCFSRHENVAHIALLTAAGFAMVRSFTEMERPLTELAPHTTPPGVVLVPFTPSLSEAVRVAHNEAFADHWGLESYTAEKWRFFLNHESFRPDLSAVALDEMTREVAGYQMSKFDPQDGADDGRRAGYTEVLGVRRPWRGRGIAPALLADAMHRYKAAGMNSATLDVDTENPSGALALYKNLGYTAMPGRVTIAWDKKL